jgi:hypothetical protein
MARIVVIAGKGKKELLFYYAMFAKGMGKKIELNVSLLSK